MENRMYERDLDDPYVVAELIDVHKSKWSFIEIAKTVSLIIVTAMLVGMAVIGIMILMLYVSKPYY